MNKINGYCLCVLLVTLGITFFTRNDVRSVRDIASEVLQPPLQTELDDHGVIRFRRNDYAYELTPVYGYEICGLITSRINYSLFTIYKSEKTFPVDLCLIWGSNARNRIFGDPNVRFSQDCRFCWVQWSGQKEFDFSEFSNNHLLTRDLSLEKKIKDLHAGDQVLLRGKLVNVRAKLLGKGGAYDAPEIAWNTSVTRSDNGAGACEVLYVEEVEILRKANRLSCLLFSGSAWGLFLWFLGNMICFIRGWIVVMKEAAELPERPS